MSEFELRTLSEPIELRKSGDKITAVGYAIVYNRLSANMGGFVEMAAPGLADKTIQEQDIRALVDHDISKIIGRSGAGTLRLESDGTGLRYEIDLPDTTVGRDIAVSLDRGDVVGSSFGFRALEDEWSETEQGFPLRTLKQIVLRDVGPVTFPAYPDASAALRSLADNSGLELAEVRSLAVANDLITLIRREDEDTETEGESRAKPTHTYRRRRVV